MVPVITGSNRGLVAQDPPPGLHLGGHRSGEMATNAVSGGISRTISAIEKSVKWSVPHYADPADRPLGGIQHKDGVRALSKRPQVDDLTVSRAQDQ